MSRPAARATFSTVAGIIANGKVVGYGPLPGLPALGRRRIERRKKTWKRNGVNFVTKPLGLMTFGNASTTTPLGRTAPANRTNADSGSLRCSKTYQQTIAS